MNTSIANIDSETGYINICPKIDGRIVNIRPPIIHEDSENIEKCL